MCRILLAKLPKGYEWIEDNQSADNTTVAFINRKGETTYKRVAPTNIELGEKTCA